MDICFIKSNDCSLPPKIHHLKPICIFHLLYEMTRLLSSLNGIKEITIFIILFLNPQQNRLVCGVHSKLIMAIQCGTPILQLLF